MLFISEYELSWDGLEAVVAKRMEWDGIKPEGFRYIAEYVWPDDDAPFSRDRHR